MPRKPRYYLAGVPCHVIQRGNNRAPCFFADEDYCYYLECLEQASSKCGCAVHAYVLMTNHVHVLMTPRDRDGISRTMQSVGCRYVQYVNHCYGRSGTLWEGRHKASLVDSERYLLACYRYIELNPVWAGMVRRPEDYRWSSCRTHTQGKPSSLIQDHGQYLGLGTGKEARQQVYRELLKVQPDDDEVHVIRSAASLGVPLGSNQFRAEVERILCRRISYRPRGRPRKRLKGMRERQEEDQLRLIK